MGAFVCVEPWAGGRGGAAPAPTGLGCGTDVPASDRRSEIAHAHTRAQTACSAAHPRPGRDRASVTRRWQLRTWQPGRQAWPLHRAFLCGRLPPNLIRFRPPPAQRPQPVPAAPRQQVRRRVGPLARGWRWRTSPGDGAGAWSAGHFMAALRSAQEDCVNRPRITFFLWFSAPRSAQHDP
jgi:hypothetical protein